MLEYSSIESFKKPNRIVVFIGDVILSMVSFYKHKLIS